MKLAVLFSFFLAQLSPLSATGFSHENELIGSYVTSTSNPSDRSIFQFCKDLINNSTDITTSSTREEVSQILFLYDYNKKILAELINPLDLPGTKAKLSLCFAKAMNDISQSLIKLKIAHQITGLQNGSFSVEEHLARYVAHCLISSKGVINFGIISMLKKHLLPSVTLRYQKDIARVLDLLDRISMDEEELRTWNNLFNTITKPQSPTSSVNNLIRVTLNLPKKSLVTDRHAKEVFLYFFIGQSRQKSAEENFEEWWRIFAKEHWQTIAKDGIELLKYGALLKNINNSQKIFPYIFDISDSDLQNKITIDQKGMLRGGMTLFDAPGIKIAAEQMGIENFSSILNSTTSLLLGHKLSDSFTAEEVIKALAKASILEKINAEDDLENLIQLGMFAFSGEIRCIPFEMYHSALLSFEKGSTQADRVRSSMLNAVEKALESQWYKGTFPWQFPGIDKTKDLFFDFLNSEVSFYPKDNCDIFEMHRSSGQTIASPFDFQNLLVDIFKKVKIKAEQLSKDSLINFLTLKWIQDTANKLSLHISTNEDFMKLVLWSYHLENRQEPDPVLFWKNLNHFPWLDTKPDDFGEILAEKISTQVIPKNAHQLASSFIKTIRTLNNKNYNFNGITLKNNNYSYSCRLDSKDLFDAVNCSLSIEDWLSKRFFQSGYTVSKASLPKYCADNFVQVLVNALPQSERNLFLVKTMHAYQEGICVRDFGRKLMRALIDIDPKYQETQTYHKFSYILTTAALQVLPPNMLLTLKNASLQVFIAKCNDNFEDQEKDQHFCFFFDPINEDILFGTANEDDTELSLVDQNKWINGQLWDFVPCYL